MSFPRKRESRSPLSRGRRSMMSVGFRTLVRREILRYFVVFTQTIVPPIVSATLFLFVFGYSIGSHLGSTFGDTGYLPFLIPGLVMMHLIEAPYQNCSSSLYISRWQNLIQELLLSPLSYGEMVLGLLLGGVTRGLIVASGVYAVSLVFVQFPIAHPLAVFYFAVTVTIIFASLGLLVGLWAEGFEKLSIWGTFVLTPLIYLGGVFHSIEMVPAPLKILTRIDPIFYLVSGLRWGMTGRSDADPAFCMGLAAVLAVALFILVERLFAAGYKLRT